MIGVTFIDDQGEVKTQDYDLVLESTDLTFPEPKRETIDIPGRDGVLDLTGKLSGEVRYKNRTLTLHFVDLHDYKHYSAIESMLANRIQGKEFKIVLDKDKRYYYQGRVWISSYKPVGKTEASEVVITCDVEPFKYLREKYSGPWKWDPFNFYTGKITSTVTEVEGEKTIMMDPGVCGAVPTFKVSGDLRVGFNGKHYELPEGESVNYEIYLTPGKNTLYFVGKGSVEIEIEGREL